MPKWLVIFTIASGVLVIAFFVYNSGHSSCDGIVKQTFPNLAANLAAFKASGEGIIGKEKIQDIDAQSQKIVALLKTCCLSLHNGSMKPEKHQLCLSKAKNFEEKLLQVSKVFEEAEADMQEGKLQEMDEKVTEAQTLVDEFTLIVRDLDSLTEADETVNPAKPIESAKP